MRVCVCVCVCVCVVVVVLVLVVAVEGRWHVGECQMGWMRSLKHGCTCTKIAFQTEDSQAQVVAISHHSLLSV